MKFVSHLLSSGTLVSSTNKTGRHEKNEVLLEKMLNARNLIYK
jgi:hypothetical protein